MKTWNILINTPEHVEERFVKAETLAEAMQKTLPDDTNHCWGQEVEDINL